MLGIITLVGVIAFVLVAFIYDAYLKTLKARTTQTAIEAGLHQEVVTKRTHYSNDGLMHLREEKFENIVVWVRNSDTPIIADGGPDGPDGDDEDHEDAAKARRAQALRSQS